MPEKRKLPKEKIDTVLKSYMNGNSTLENVSYIVANNLDAYDEHYIHLVLEVMQKHQNSKFVIDGNGGEGKTTFAFRLAVKLGMKDHFVFFMDLKQQSSDLTPNDIEQFIASMEQNNGSEMVKEFLFVDNPYANPQILEWIHNSITYQFSTINIVLIERVNRLKMLFNSNANYFSEWEDGLFYIHLRNTDRKNIPNNENKNELFINRSYSMRKCIVKTMIRTITQINTYIVKKVFNTYLNDILNNKNITIVETMFYFKFKYNELIIENNLPVSKRIPLDWDEWNELLEKYNLSMRYGYGYIAALYLFYFEYPADALLRERPEFLSVLNTLSEEANVEPLIYAKEKKRLYPKHEVIAEMYFRFCKLDDITEFLIYHFPKFSPASQKAFVFQVMKRQYVLEGNIGGLVIDFDKVYKVIKLECEYLNIPDRIALIGFWLSHWHKETNLSEIEKLIMQYPQSRDILMEYIDVCLEHKNYKQCEEGLKALLQMNSNDYRILRFISNIYYKMSNIKYAVTYLYTAAKTSPNRLQDYYRIEKLLEESGTNYELIKIRTRINQMEHNVFSNYTKLDNVLKKENRISDCYKNYEYMQHYLPQNPWGYEKMIEMAFLCGHFHRAFKSIQKYYYQFHLRTERIQLKIIKSWVYICWCDKEYIEKVKSLVWVDKSIIAKIWKHTENENLIRWISLLCMELEIYNILPFSDEEENKSKKEMLFLLERLKNRKSEASLQGIKVRWPSDFFEKILAESKGYFRKQTIIWTSYIDFLYCLFEKLLSICNQDPYLEKTLYWDMMPHMKSIVSYSMHRFMDKEQQNIEKILDCIFKYEITFFLAPFHWYEKYFDGKPQKAKKLESIVLEKQKIIANIHKIYIKSAEELLEHKETELANQLLGQIIKRYPKMLKYKIIYLKSFMQMKKDEGVYQEFLNILNLCKDNLPNEVFSSTIEYFSKCGNWRMAKKIIENADPVISERKQFKVCKMQTYLLMGEIEQSMEIALDLQNTTKPLLSVCDCLYRVFCQLDNMEKAKEIAYYGVEQFPKREIAYINLVDYLCRTGKKEEALDICTNEQFASAPMVLKLGKELSCECGQYKRAVAFYNNYSRCMCTRADLERLSYDDIADGLYLTGKTSLLKRFLKNIRRRYGNEKVVHKYLNEILSPTLSVWEQISKK